MKTKCYPNNKANQARVSAAISELAALVGHTLGPGGRPILIERENHPPLSTKDGVTVARAYRASGSIERVVSDAAKEVCERTVRLAGDGPQPLHSKVLTPTGFVNMGDIRVGMDICGTNGTIQKVEGVFPKGKKEIYEVEFENRGIVECCEDHLWSVTDAFTLKRIKKTITVKEISEEYFKTTKEGDKKYRYFTPNTYVEFCEDPSKMPIDPYLLGVLIGDGCLRESGSIEIGLSKHHIIEKLKLPEGIFLNVKYVAKKNYFRIKIVGKTKSGKSIRDIMGSLGLNNVSSGTKFIPKSYLYSSKQSREALLQGLIDTDGYINRQGRFEYSTISDRLAVDFADLVRSLGKTVHKRLHDRKNDTDSYSDVSIHRIQELRGYKEGSKIVRITPTGKSAKMQCLKVSNPDSLYITDNYNVTHNTTTAIVLAASLVVEGQKYLNENTDLSPQSLSRELKRVYQEIINPEITKMSRSISGLPDGEAEAAIKHVALVSSNHDIEIANAVAEAVAFVGEDGMVTAEEGAGTETRVEYSEGFPFMSGLHDLGTSAGPSFVNRQDYGDCSVDSGAFVVLYDGEINDVSVVQPLMERVVTLKDDSGLPTRASVVVFAHRFSDIVLKTFAQNFRRGILTIVPVITPRNGQSVGRSQFLHDLAAYCDGTVFDAQGMPLQESLPSMFGTIDSIKIGRSEGVILGKPTLERVGARISDLKAQMTASSATEFDRDLIRYRIGRMTGGVATIYAGGASALEAKERHARVVDAISAVRSAIQSGVVPGGGVTLAVIARKMKKENSVESIFATALLSPFNLILENAGVYSSDIGNLLEKVGASGDSFVIYDALSQEIKDWWESGILDPAKVTTSALENALSVAQLLMTLGGVIVTEFTEEEDRLKMMQDGIMKRVEEEALE